MLNGVLRRACGKFSLWDKHPCPPPARMAAIEQSAWWWPVYGLGSVLFAGLWAITLLTYLLPPAEIWHNLLHASLTPNQARFLGAGTLVFSLEFLLAGTPPVLPLWLCRRLVSKFGLDGQPQRDGGGL